MTENENDQEEVRGEEINLQYHWYLSAFGVIYFGSLLIPAIIFMSYIMLLYLPFFLDTSNFVSLFLQLEPLIASLLMPVIIICCYLIHIFIAALITRWFWSITEKKAPSKSGDIPRNIPSKYLNYYHIRSFIIKYPKNAVNRGPFPFLMRWLYNFIGTNKIGKGSVIEENLAADRFLDVGDNTYFGTGTAMTSHAVDGIFGNISYYKIKVGKNVTTGAYSMIGPGSEIGDDVVLLPISGVTKHNILKNDNYYFGGPIRRIFKKRLTEYLQVSIEDIQNANEKVKQYNEKKKKRIKDE
jgi:acetyltransferase-like isoleucine patch superfamily enzyme